MTAAGGAIELAYDDYEGLDELQEQRDGDSDAHSSEADKHEPEWNGKAKRFQRLVLNMTAMERGLDNIRHVLYQALQNNAPDPRRSISEALPGMVRHRAPPALTNLRVCVFPKKPTVGGVGKNERRWSGQARRTTIRCRLPLRTARADRCAEAHRLDRCLAQARHWLARP